MVNIYGTMIFKSRYEEDLTKIFDVLTEYENKVNSMNNFLLSIGYTQPEIMDSITPDDKVCYVDDEISNIDNEYLYFRIDFESHPNFPKFLSNCIKSKYKVEVVYQYDNLDNNVFVNTDSSGLYLPDRYLIDTYISHTDEYYTVSVETLEEAVEEVCSHFVDFREYSKGKYKSVVDVNELIQEYLSEDDSYSNIYEYDKEDN